MPCTHRLAIEAVQIKGRLWAALQIKERDPCCCCRNKRQRERNRGATNLSNYGTAYRPKWESALLQKGKLEIELHSRDERIIVAVSTKDIGEETAARGPTPAPSQSTEGVRSRTEEKVTRKHTAAKMQFAEETHLDFGALRHPTSQFAEAFRQHVMIPLAVNARKSAGSAANCNNRDGLLFHVARNCKLMKMIKSVLVAFCADHSAWFCQQWPCQQAQCARGSAIKASLSSVVPGSTSNPDLKRRPVDYSRRLHINDQKRPVDNRPLHKQDEDQRLTEASCGGRLRH